MKRGKKLAIVAALMTMLVAVTAWATEANVQVFTNRVVATASNSSPYYAMVCSGRVIGQRSDGSVLYAWMRNVVVPPGEYRFVFVSTDPTYLPFVDGRSDIVCSY